MEMKTKTTLTSVAMFLAGFALLFAADLNMGTWKLNAAKSKFSPGASRNNTVVYEAAGDSVKVTVDGIDSEGKPAHNVWTGKFDGKDYAVTGDPNSDTRSYVSVDSQTMTLSVKKGSDETVTGRIVVAANGKSRTVTTSSTDSKGNKITNVAAYDKK
jgi:hypothetical protein